MRLALTLAVTFDLREWGVLFYCAGGFMALHVGPFVVGLTANDERCE